MTSPRIIRNIAEKIARQENKILNRKIAEHVFLLKNSRKINLVLKLFNENKKELGFVSETEVKNKITAIKAVVKSNSEIIVPIHKIDYVKYSDKFYIYYIMDRLQEVPYYEASVLVTALDEIDDIFNYHSVNNGIIRQMMKCFSPEAKTFGSKILRSDYWDLHAFNIMRNAEGQYKLIDIEGFSDLSMEVANQPPRPRTYYDL